MSGAEDKALTVPADHHAVHDVVGGPANDVAFPAPDRAQLDALEARMVQLPQIEIPVQHRFAEKQGLYAREIVIPKGALMTGRVHKHQHVSIMIRGDMSVLTDKGMERVSGYRCWICEPGTKRVGYAHEETVWLTVHHTDHMTAEGIEDAICEPMHVKPADSLLARNDFASFLVEYQINTEVMDAQVSNTADQMPFPDGPWAVEVKASAVHGLGLFATAPIKAGDVVAPARIGKFRTPAGRFTNHAPNPNAHMARQKHVGINLVASRDIAAGEELFINYRAALAVALQEEKQCLQ